MRVTENQAKIKFPMGKRKHKLHKKGKNNDIMNSDSSDEGNNVAAGPKCPHIIKALNFSAVKKALKQHGSVGECKDCGNEKNDSKPGSPILGVAGGDEASDLINCVWLCLQCGNQGCGRNSRHKHALLHYKTPRSNSHALVLNLSSWTLWCYDCDDDVPVAGNKKLTESVEFVRKMAGMSASAPLSKGMQRMDSKEEEEVKEENQSSLQRSDSMNRSKPPNVVLPKVKGLTNLGNTCFFNAVMQSLSQSQVLESVLSETGKATTVQLPGMIRSISDSEDDDDSNDDSDCKLPSLNPIPIQLADRNSGLTTALLSFLKDMNNPSKNNVVSPGSLFSQVCRKAPRFKGFQQQDSHELLRHLLDGMKTEEITRARAAILKKFDISENSKNAKVDDEVKMKVKEYGRQAKHTFVDDVFGGYFISTVLCEECQVPSQILEPFLDISLPIMEEKTVRPYNFSYRGGGASGGGGKKTAAVGAEGAGGKPAPLAAEEDDLDGGANATGLSKHASKKMRKQSKKAAKRKGSSSTVKEAADKSSGDNKESNSAKVNGTADNSSDDMSDADVEDNIESDASRRRRRKQGQGLQRSDSTESASGAGGRKGGDDGSVSQNELSVTSEDTTLVEDSSSTINGDRNTSPDQHDDKQQDKHSGNKAINVHKLTEGLNSLKLTENNTPGSDQTQHSAHLTHSPHSTDENNDNDNSCKHKTPAAAMCNGHGTESRHKKMAARHELCRRGATSTLGQRYQPVSHECSVQSCLHQFTSAELLTGNNKFGCENCTKNKHKNSGKKEMVYCNASKQLLIFSPPLILTLHLKRFSQIGFSLRKVSRKVEFPAVLDLAPYCSELCQGVPSGQTKVLYSLYGIVEHSGRLTGGHYTAYVKVRSSVDQRRVGSFLEHGCRIQGRKLHKILQELDRQHKLPAPAPPHHDPPPPPPSGRWFYISDSKVSEVANESNIFNREAYLLFYERWF